MIIAPGDSSNPTRFTSGPVDRRVPGLKRAAGLEKGSPESNRTKVGNVTRDQVKEIAELKMADLNAGDLEAAMRMVEGTARSAGITVEG